MTSNGPWVPLSIRGTQQAEQWRSVLFEGVPSHLRTSLRALIDERLRVTGGASAVQRRLRLTLTPLAGEGIVEPLLELADMNPETALDIVDCLVDEARRADVNLPTNARGEDFETRQSIYGFVRELEVVLDEANSTWRVSRPENGRWLLERRVDATTTAAAHDLFERRTTAADLLAAAWAATFRRAPDLTAAYRNVVLAVESVATPVLTPKDTSPTLGKAIAHLRDTTARWTVADLDDQGQKSALTLLGMLQTLWQNHQRHVAAGGHAPAPVQQDEAEAALLLGITVVQWFERGHVRHLAP